MVTQTRPANPEPALSGTHQILGLIDAIYATVDNPALWPVVAERIQLAIQDDSLALRIGCRRPKSRGTLHANAPRILRILKPHLQRALHLHAQFGTLKAQSLGWQAALEAFDHAVLGLDKHGKVVLFNRHAEAMAASGNGIKLVHGRLRATEPSCDTRLQKMIATTLGAAEADDSLSSGGSILLERPEQPERPERQPQSTPLRLTATPFHVPHIPGSPARHPIAALLFISDPVKAPLSRAAGLQSLYGLTPAEGRVADLLLQGLETAEAAARLGITLETARLYVKRILAKTGVPRQAELIRLMASMPGCS